MVYQLKRFVWDFPRRIRSTIRKSKRTWRKLTAPLRKTPDFIIIGTAKCGTVSLMTYLREHPDVMMSFSRDVGYWGYRFNEPIRVYKSKFPLKLAVWWRSRRSGRPVVVGERSHDYLIDPDVPARVRKHMPDVKLVVLLRNPINRAYSHYQHTARRDPYDGPDELSFEEALAAEEDRLAHGEFWSIDMPPRPTLADGSPFPNFRYYGYKHIGRYAEHIKNWLDVFPREQMIVIRSADFFKDTTRVFNELLDFLGVSTWEPPAFQPQNTASYEPMSEETRAELARYFEPHNKALEDLLGREFNWK